MVLASSATRHEMDGVELGGADACGHSRWGLRWSSLWGHETRVGVTKDDGEDAQRADARGGRKRRK